MDVYWPWWQGALALGAVAAGFRWTVGRPLGVSGSVRSVCHPQQTAQMDAARARMADQKATADALLAATLEAFSAEEIAAMQQAELPPPVVTEPMSQPLRLAEHACLLAGIFVGGLVAAALGVGVAAVPAGITLDAAGALKGVGVGLLVGMGATMMGGCTSGHGLHGCSSLKAHSLLATVLFFGTAVVVTWAARAVGGT